MAIPDDALNEVYDHVGGTELSHKPDSKAIGHENDFVREQVVLALKKDDQLRSLGNITATVTENEILLAAAWTDEEQRALAERIARLLAVGRVVRSERTR